MFADGVEPPLSDPLQLVEPTVLERDLRACDEIFDGARDENLTGLCLRRDSCSDRNGNSARLFPHQLALAGVKTSTDLKPERAHVLYQCSRTLDRTPRPIESSEKAITRSVDFRAVELPEPAANKSVMTLEKRTPSRVPELGRAFCGADNVGKQHGCENSLWFLWPADAGQEPLGLAHRLFVHLVIDPREEAAQPGELSDLAPGDSLRDVLRLRALPRFAMNQRRDAHRRQDVAHVRFLHRPEKRERRARAEASAHVPDEPSLEGVVAGQVGSPLTQQLGEEFALSPAFPHRRKAPTPLLLVRRPRIVRTSRSADGRFEQDEPGRALRVRSCEQERSP